MKFLIMKSKKITVNLNKHVKYLFTIVFIAFYLIASAQIDDKNEEEVNQVKKNKIQTGFYIGSYFANNYSASTYNGYGYDLNGDQNTFLNSVMYQKIKNIYGGGFGQYDQIANALSVDQGQWEFNESDMPRNMSYIPSILVGLNFKIPLVNNSAFTFNLNSAKLVVEGNFNITLLKVSGTNPALNSNIKTFPIKGSEQRTLFQLGYQKIFGDHQKMNFFLEIGFNGTLTKYNSSTIYINDLQIDLTYTNNINNIPVINSTKNLIGFGIGAYGGLGLNINLNSQFTAQFLYSPSQEKVNIGNNPTLKIQNGVGFRLYYNF